MDKLIRELKEENEKLKKSLQGGGVPEVGGGALSAEGASICLRAFRTPCIKNDWLNIVNMGLMFLPDKLLNIGLTLLTTPSTIHVFPMSICLCFFTNRKRENEKGNGSRNPSTVGFESRSDAKLG